MISPGATNRFYWILYLTFFIVVFPMIFEYKSVLIGGEQTFEYNTSWKVLTYLMIGTFGWIVLIGKFYRKTVYRSIKADNETKITLREGVLRSARVESKKIVRENHKEQVLVLEVSFKNLSGVRLKMPYKIKVKALEPRRFDIGKNITIRINTRMRSPLIVFDGSSMRKRSFINWNTVGLIFSLSFCIGYLIFSYWYQNNGLGWRFLHVFHPWVAIPFYTLFFGAVIGNLMFTDLLEVNTKRAVKERTILMKGKLAMATLRERKETGWYVNQQPQILFDFDFVDHKGNIHTARVKQVVSNLDLDNTNTSEIPVFYLSEDPGQVLIADKFYVEAG